MESFCADCNFIRRLYLLHNPKDFIEKIRRVFLTESLDDTSRPVPSRETAMPPPDDEPPIRNFIDKRTTKLTGYCD
jgi:hypothetical protein